MKSHKILVVIASLALLCGVNACSGKWRKAEKAAPTEPAALTSASQQQSNVPPQMPARYQNPGYMTPKNVMDDDFGGEQDEFQIRVGATIKSTS